MSYKTLIIVDNSSELTTLNQEIIRHTLKYFISHLDTDDKVAIAVTGEKAEYITDFEDSLNTQLKTVEELQFTDINAPGADVIMDVVLDWSKGDLACRDILYISARGLNIQSDYSEEELLFEVNNKLYPIYTLACEQNENKGVIKSMGALSRISGGVSVTTSDAKEDANVERQLSEMLLEAMKEQRRKEEERYLDVYADEEQETFDNKEDSIEADDEEYNEMTEGEDAENNEEELENIVYEMPDYQPAEQSIMKFKMPIIMSIFFLIFVVIFSILKKIKNRREEEKYFNTLNRKETADSKKRIPFEGAKVAETGTVCLSDNNDVCDTGTRLLYQARDGIEITLEDRANPTKYYRACVRDSIVIGRNEKLCDVAISYDDSISSRHCELYLRDNQIYCRDLSSSNGTMINQQKVYQELKIESGDILRIGRLSFIIQIVEEVYE